MAVLIKLSRAEFVAAIENGIRAAGDELTDDDRARLRAYAQVARECGTNYSTGCPAAAVLMPNYRSDDDLVPGAGEFASGFDGAWLPELRYGSWSNAPARIVVEN